MTIYLPIVTVSESNWSGAFRVKLRRKKAQREAAYLITRDRINRGHRPQKSISIRQVRMVRCATRLLDPGNLPAALKHCQDGVCLALGIDDGPRTGIKWAYSQEIVRKADVGVRVEIE